MITAATWPGNKGSPLQKETEKILGDHRIDKEEFRFGKTKIFIRNPKTVNDTKKYSLIIIIIYIYIYNISPFFPTDD